MKKIFIFTLISLLVNISSSYAINYLNSITTSTISDKTTITVKCSGPIEYTQNKLVDTKRIYFDFKNTIIKSAKSISVNKNYIKSIRSAQNAVKPTYITRVVFDMEKITEYDITLSSDKKQMNIVFTGTNIATSRGNIDREIKKVNKKIIVIDAGHGGKDAGAVFGTLFEKSINLDIAKRLNKLLVNAGYDVIMTRKTDKYIELSERARIANDYKADLFISIHNNSMPSGFAGPMTLYNSRDISQDFSSKDLAEIIQTRLEGLGTGSIGIRERNELSVLKQTKMPAIIAEVGCMSNSKEKTLLMKASFRQKVAKLLFEAIDNIDF